MGGGDAEGARYGQTFCWLESHEAEGARCGQTFFWLESHEGPTPRYTHTHMLRKCLNSEKSILFISVFWALSKCNLSGSGFLNLVLIMVRLFGLN